MSAPNDQRVVCAAIRHPDGRLICSPRHFDTTTHAVLDHLEKTEDIRTWGQADQGFVDQYGIYLTREEAWVIALRQNQIIHRVGGDEGCLYSENLY